MTEYLPQALSASYGCCRTDALEGFTGNEAVICDVERHSNKMNNAAHRLPSPNALPDAVVCRDKRILHHWSGATQLAFANSASSGESRYIPDMVSTQQR